jgi:putative spermidine/putrescine transport system substrate-binding protein
MNRFQLLLGCVIAVLLGIACDGKKPSSAQHKFTVVSYGGGAYQQSHKDAFITPFNALTGSVADSTTWDANYGKIKAMVESGQVTWDAVDVTAAIYNRGVKEGLFEKLRVPVERKNFLEGAVGEYGVANVYWGTVLAYRKDLGKEAPRDWADFWDINRFPGDRALYDDPRATLELALLADGVEKEKLYPLDVDRAFRKLDQIKPHVKVWWTDGSAPVQLLLNKTVTMTPCWNGRIFASRDAQAQIDYRWDGAALELDYWVIPRGSKNAESASRFIAFASTAEPMAHQAEIVGYGPVNARALRLLEPDIARQLPTHEGNWRKSFVVDAAWWAANETDVKKRWTEWRSR